jgi:hypothetical protein
MKTVRLQAKPREGSEKGAKAQGVLEAKEVASSISTK